MVKKFACYLIILLSACSLLAQSSTLSVDLRTRFQTLDGFGAHQSGSSLDQGWWNQLFFEDMDCSIFRVDLTPVLTAPYSDLSYYSPWFMGSQVRSVFNLEDPANPNGPENNRVRTYTGPNDYGRTFGGRNAPIAIMGPDLNRNISLFRYQSNQAMRKIASDQMSGIPRTLTGSIWSPLPWVKVSSGNRYNQNWWPGPVQNTPWPFIWGGNFAGGRLDVSGTPLQVFNDSQAGGSGPTSALTQFARSTAAYIAGFQRFHNVKFYAVSIQNELNFEQFYNSATYPLSSQYLTAVKAVKAEFAKHSELRDIKIMGPEDLLGGDAYGLWEYGGPIHKNLQYLQNIYRDPEASQAVDFFCVHGYAPDGVSSAGSDPRQWTWWANGWTGSPAPGIPSNVKGFKSYGKKSWMTETSGEHPDWIFPKSAFPGQGAFSIAVKIHQALTAGEESAWIYWTFADTDANGNVSDQGLTSQALGANSPKYVAAKHFFKFIRPGARLIKSNLSAPTGVHASSYYSESDRSLVQVIINATASQQSIRIQWPSALSELQAFTSSQGSYWQRSSPSFQNNESVINLPPYSVVTLKAGEMVSKTNQESSDETIRMFFQKNDDQGNVHLILDSDQAGSASLSLYSLQGVRLYSAKGLSIQSGWNKIQVPPYLPPHQLVLAQIELNGISLTRKLLF